MTAITESDLKNLEALINNRFDKLEDRFDKLEERVKAVEEGQKNLEIGLAEIGGKLSAVEPFIQKIPDLTETFGELKNWKQIGVITLTALISSVLTGSIGGVIGWFLRGGSRI